MHQHEFETASLLATINGCLELQSLPMKKLVCNRADHITQNHQCCQRQSVQVHSVDTDCAADNCHPDDDFTPDDNNAQCACDVAVNVICCHDPNESINEPCLVC